MLFVAASTILPVLADADDAICEGGKVSVTAPDHAIAQSVCNSVETALSLLDQCDLQLSEPVTISVFDDLPNFDHNCFGFYRCEDNQISLISPSTISEVSAQSDLYLGFDPQVVFDSIVVHEVAHAAFSHSACQESACLANQEYVAYAVQMWSMPLPVRDEIIARFGQDKPVEPVRLNDLVAAMAPEKFAALAWQHFNEPGHGCDFIQGLATGRTSLAMPWQ
jgi:hypothetical protein